MAISIGKAARLLGVCAALVALPSTGCDKMKAEQTARNAETRVEIEKEYGRLGFMIAELDKHERQAISCRDAELPKRLKRSSRRCEQLALTDEGNLRRLFGEKRASPPVETESIAAWSWMRTLSFDRLGPLDAIKEGNPLGTHKSALATLSNTNVGVFTENTIKGSESRKRYSGYLVIFDTDEEILRCQIAIEAEVAKIFNPPPDLRFEIPAEGSPKEHIERFYREVDKQLVPITKNFCVD